MSNRLWVGPALVLAAVVAGCGESEEEARERRTQGVKDVEVVGEGGDVVDRRPPKPGDKLYEVADFKFLDVYKGMPLSLGDLKGKVWVASFIFTNCASHCVRMCGEMAKLQEEFADHPDFRIVQTTVDPARDTPGVLKRFGKQWEADPDTWIFLYGKREDIGKFAKHGVKIPWQDDEPLNHSTKIILVGRDGYVRGAFDIFERDDLKELRATVEKVIAEKKTP